MSVGSLGKNLPTERRGAILDHPGASTVSTFAVDALSAGVQVSYGRDVDLALNIVGLDGGVAIHVIRYAYDALADAVPILPALDMVVRLDGDYDAVQFFSPGRELHGSMSQEGDRYHITMRNLPLYGIVFLKEAGG